MEAASAGSGISKRTIYKYFMAIHPTAALLATAHALDNLYSLRVDDSASVGAALRFQRVHLVDWLSGGMEFRAEARLAGNG
jgi:hypothetical protein